MNYHINRVRCLVHLREEGGGREEHLGVHDDPQLRHALVCVLPCCVCVCFGVYCVVLLVCGVLVGPVLGSVVGGSILYIYPTLRPNLSEWQRGPFPASPTTARKKAR